MVDAPSANQPGPSMLVAVVSEDMFVWMDANAPMIYALSAGFLVTEHVFQVTTLVRTMTSVSMDTADLGRGTAQTIVPKFWIAAPWMVSAAVAGLILGFRRTFQLMHAAANLKLPGILMIA